MLKVKIGLGTEVPDRCTETAVDLHDIPDLRQQEITTRLFYCQ